MGSWSNTLHTQTYQIGHMLAHGHKVSTVDGALAVHSELRERMPHHLNFLRRLLLAPQYGHEKVDLVELKRPA